MADELTQLSPFEAAALTVQLRRLRGTDLLQVMQQAEPGWSNSTYYRRLNDAFVSLEKRGLVTRTYGKGHEVVWTVNKDASKMLSLSELFDHCSYLGANIDTLENTCSALQDQLLHSRRQLEAEIEAKTVINNELDTLKKKYQESLQYRLTTKFPGLDLSEMWIETILLLALVEVMARHKLTVLHADKTEDMPFSQIFMRLKELLPEVEGRVFQFDKDILNILYKVRSRMIHSGLDASLRESEVKAINALIQDIYQQLFEKPPNA
jgi:hypothetical protein